MTNSTLNSYSLEYLGRGGGGGGWGGYLSELRTQNSETLFRYIGSWNKIHYMVI